MAVEIIDGHVGKAHIDSSDMAVLNQCAFGVSNAVFRYGNIFKATVSSQTKVVIGSGAGMVSGRRFINWSSAEVTIPTGEVGKKRNDIICAKYAKDSSGIESVQLVVVKGTATTSTPSDPVIPPDHMKLWRIPMNGTSAGDPVSVMPKSYVWLTTSDGGSPSLDWPAGGIVGRVGKKLFEGSISVGGSATVKDLGLYRLLAVCTDSNLKQGSWLVRSTADPSSLISYNLSADTMKAVWLTACAFTASGDKLTLDKYSSVHISSDGNWWQDRQPEKILIVGYL